MDHAYLARGLSLAVEAALARLKEVIVVTPGRPALPDGLSWAGELGVRYIVTGTVWTHGPRMRVSVRLLAAATSVCLWAETYAREVDDLFDVLNDITGQIVGRIGTEMLVAEYARTRRTPTPALGARACVVQALAAASNQSEHDTRSALDLLDQALVRQSGYPTAMGMKAWIMVFRAFQGWQPMASSLDEAGHLIATGLSHDNEALWPLLAQAMVGFGVRDNPLSVASLERALGTCPNSLNAHGLLAVAHAFGSRPALALASLGRATRLSPRDKYADRDRQPDRRRRRQPGQQLHGRGGRHCMRQWLRHLCHDGGRGVDLCG
jgi:adenylate cyclase